MFTVQNILLFIALAFFLMNFQVIVAGFVLFFWELRDVVIRKIGLEEMSDSVKDIIRPNEEFLLSKGFVYQSSQVCNSILVRIKDDFHTNYYYNEELGVHAFLETTPLPGALSSSVVSFVTFYESYKRAVSFDCFAYNVFVSDETYLFDHYYGSYEEAFNAHLQDREIEGEVIAKGVLTAEGAKDYKQYTITETIEVLMEQNIMKKVANGYRYLFSFAYVKYIHFTLKMHKKAQKIYALRRVEQKTTQTEVQGMLYKTSEERALLALLNQKPNEKSKEGKIKTFLVSGAFFVLFFTLIGIPLSSMPIIIAILLIHELGHYFAMKFFGYTDTSIFFIPLFGAAAKGEKEHTKPLEEYIVFLAGPLPGIILSFVIAFFMWQNPSLIENDWLREFAIISFVLNFINLLPIYPLDGGRIVQTLVFTRYPKVQFYFFLVSLTVIIIAAVAMQSIVLGFFAMVLFMSINHNYNLSILLSNLVNNKSNSDVKERVIRHITETARFKDLGIEKKLLLAKQALKLLNAEVSSKLLMLLGMVFYLFLLIVPFAIIILTGISSLN